MSHSIALGFLWFLVLAPTVLSVLAFLRRKKRGRPEIATLLMSFGQLFVSGAMVAPLFWHMTFVRLLPLLGVGVLFGLVGGFLFFDEQVVEEEQQIAAGNPPKRYNDWAKPDPE